MVGGISGWQLMILLLIVVLVFGTKRLRNIGGDLGSAVKGFKKGMEDDSEPEEPEQLDWLNFALQYLGLIRQLARTSRN